MLGAWEIGVCAFAVTFAFAVRGATGFGASTVAIPMMAFALPVTLAVPVVSSLIVVTAVPQALRERRKIAWPEVLKAIPYSLLGVALGLAIFSNSGEAFLLRSLGVVIVVYGLVGLLAKGQTLEIRPGWRHGAAAVAGLTGGSVGAVYGAGSAPIYGMYLNSLNLEKTVFRVTVSTVMLVPIGARVFGYGGLGYFSADVLTLLVIALPFMFIGSKVGDSVLRGLDKARFGQLVSGVLVLSGIGLVVK